MRVGERNEGRDLIQIWTEGEIKFRKCIGIFTQLLRQMWPLCYDQYSSCYEDVKSVSRIGKCLVTGVVNK